MGSSGSMGMSGGMGGNNNCNCDLETITFIFQPVCDATTNTQCDTLVCEETGDPLPTSALIVCFNEFGSLIETFKAIGEAFTIGAMRVRTSITAQITCFFGIGDGVRSVDSSVLTG
jgi:hypothetical protein